MKCSPGRLPEPCLAAGAAHPASAPLPPRSLCSGESPLLQLLACPRGAVPGLSRAVCSEISAATGAKPADHGAAGIGAAGERRCITPTPPGPFCPSHPQGKGCPQEGDVASGSPSCQTVSPGLPPVRSCPPWGPRHAGPSAVEAGGSAARVGSAGCQGHRGHCDHRGVTGWWLS